jgi:hypothetical protein
MMKLTHSNGWRIATGWLLPALPTMVGAIVVFDAVLV